MILDCGQTRGFLRDGIALDEIKKDGLVSRHLEACDDCSGYALERITRGSNYRIYTYVAIAKFCDKIANDSIHDVQGPTLFNTSLDIANVKKYSDI